MEAQSKKAVILIVDDTADNLLLLSDILKPDYSVKVANSGIKALEYLRTKTKPDLILLDILMPELSGYEVIEQIKKDSSLRDIPVIFLTAKESMKDEQKGFTLGAADYITKPVSVPILHARIKTQLENKKAADFLKDQNHYLEAEVLKRTHDLLAIENVAILAMASLAETRDSETGLHIRRTQNYVKILAKKLQDHPKFSDFLTPENITILYKSAPLHDIGKVGIPDAILLKPAKLTSQEFEIMKTHTTLGKEAIEHAEQQLGYEIDFLKIAKEIVHSHQEKYDGSGYPLGLKGEEIPIAARLMAIADVYDALISERVYKKAYSHKEAVEIMREGRGSHFDPDVLDAFLEIEEEFYAIAKRFSN
ncbi:MAG: two-component system response regulator [Helicobacteraceae bacterium]|nr:two-component system response regulator [Helicobacteraceae bacterium]